MLEKLNKQTKALTINRLPRDLVDTIKHLSIEYDCNVPELMEAIILAGLKNKEGLYADIHRLRQTRLKERIERKKVKEQVEALQAKLFQEVTPDEATTKDGK